MKGGEISQSGILRQTVSLKAQTVLTKLVDAISIYNFSVTDYVLQDEIVELLNGEYHSLLERYNAPSPCPVDYFVEASCQYIHDSKSKEILRNHFDRERLLEAFENGDIEHCAEYEIELEDGKVHTILHKIVLTQDDINEGVIARCSTRDITKMVEYSKNLNVAEDRIALGMAVIESLVQDCNVIWLVDPKRRTLELYRTIGDKYVRSAVNMGTQLVKYDDVLRKYVDDYVIDSDKARVLKEAAMDVMVEGADREGLWAVNYQRIDDEGVPRFRQVICAKSTPDESESIYVLAFRDIDEQMRKEMDVAKKQEQLAVYEAEKNSMDMVHEALNAGSFTIEFDNDNQIKNATYSDVFRNMLGYESEEEFPNELESWSDLLYGEDRETVLARLWESVTDKTGKVHFDVEFRTFVKGVGYKWFLASGRVHRRNDGTTKTMLGLIKDIDESKKAENKLAEQLEIVKALSMDYLTVYKVNVEERTAEVIKLEGYQTKGVSASGLVFAYDALVRQYIRERVYPEDQQTLFEMLSLEKVTASLKKKKSYSSGYRYIDNGEIHYCQFVFIKMPKTNYIVVGFKNVDDIVNAAKERESLLLMSETDMMTGLLNRGSGENKSTMLLEKKKPGMLCILDIDKFKSINDTYGHAIGDKVIISVAQCLKDAFRERDIVFRLGGDEFAVYAVGDIEKENARKIFDRFFNKISKIEIPEIGDRKITTSVGAVLISGDNKRSFEELYKAADGCVYESKKSEGNVLNIC